MTFFGITDARRAMKSGFGSNESTLGTRRASHHDHGPHHTPTSTAPRPSGTNSFEPTEFGLKKAILPGNRRHHESCWNSIYNLGSNSHVGRSSLQTRSDIQLSIARSSLLERHCCGSDLARDLVDP